jgi:hypothetical protein
MITCFFRAGDIRALLMPTVAQSFAAKMTFWGRLELKKPLFFKRLF